ncbi:MAG: AAA family ATPase, partial [Ruminococcus sp.]|nr:AAA family ATPase [Candidatus Apopatosoma intestinale]
MENGALAPQTKVILFTSCKGGVGKTTVCANLAMSLAMMKKRVLLIDCDFGNRCLDLVLGLSDQSLYDIGDVISRRIPPEQAIIQDERNENLYFVAAPYSFDNRMSKYAFQSIIYGYRDSGAFDFIFLDTPGGIGEPLMLSASVADTAYIIVSPTKAAIRAAERTACFLQERNVARQRLIINKFCGDRAERAKAEVIDMVESTSVRLIGVVPYDPELIYAGDEGALTDELFSRNLTHAFDN